MKKIITLIALCSATAGIGQEVASSRTVKTEKEVRFQIVEVHIVANSPDVIKVDTVTGKSWVLRLASDKDREKNGIAFMWMEIPEINLRDDTAAAAAVRQVPPFSSAPSPAAADLGFRK
jgi:hypothetical protein